MGVPFTAVRGLIGSDLMKHRPDFVVMDDPFNPGEQVVVTRPLRPDVAVFHALRADRFGNAITPGLREDLMMARAARLVVVTAEEIADKELGVQDAPHNTFLPAIDVDVVVHTPGGAHPCGCEGLYREDQVHLQEYLDASKEEETFRIYLDRYIKSGGGQREYLGRVGLQAGSGGVG